MKPEQQRIAIAEACGDLTVIHVDGGFQADYPQGLYVIYDKHGRILADNIPDYLNDLNAIHEAEKTLSDKEHFIFRFELLKIVVPSSGDVSDDQRNLISSTAAQRAEAFLRTKNLWKD